MWKEKVYTGTIVLGTDTVTIKRYPDVSSTVTNVNVSKTDKLNDCIKSFLLECGVPSVVYYPCTGNDDRKGNIFINGVPFQFYVISSNMYWNAYSGNTFTIYTSSSSVIFNSSGDYSIRICLAGNPLSTFGFIIAQNGTFGGTSYGLNYLMMYKLKSEVDDSIWWLTQINGNSTGYLWLTKSDGTRPYNYALSTGMLDSANLNIPSGVMNIYQNKYPLLPRYYGFFKMVDCYQFFSSLITVGASTPTDSKFIKVGTKTYFVNYYQYPGLIIDCG